MGLPVQYILEKKICFLVRQIPKPTNAASGLRVAIVRMPENAKSATPFPQ